MFQRLSAICRTLVSRHLEQNSQLEIPLAASDAHVAAPPRLEIALAHRSWPRLLLLQLGYVSMLCLMLDLDFGAWYYINSTTQTWILVGLFSYVASKSWESLAHLIDVIKGQHLLEV